MSLNLSQPPLPRSHHRTVSLRTLDTVLETSLSPTPSPRPSTASSHSSFSTAYTSLASAPRFNYYLPHISADDAVYTRNATYACNLPSTPFQSRPPVHFGRFYQYVPELSGEEDDVYTDGVNVVYDTLRGPGQLHVQPEQKVISGFREVRYDGSCNELGSPIEHIGPEDIEYWPQIYGPEAVDGDIRGSEVGKRGGLSGDVGKRAVGERGKKVRKEKHKRSLSLAEMSEKVKEMLRRMHIGKKTRK